MGRKNLRVPVGSDNFRIMHFPSMADFSTCVSPLALVVRMPNTIHVRPCRVLLASPVVGGRC